MLIVPVGPSKRHRGERVTTPLRPVSAVLTRVTRVVTAAAIASSCVCVRQHRVGDAVVCSPDSNIWLARNVFVRSQRV